MAKVRRIVRTVFLAVFGFLVVLTAALHLLINSDAGRTAINKFFPEGMEARLDYSHLGLSVFRYFPCVGVSLDSLSLTYPHSRFEAFDSTGVWNSLLKEGRGARRDTLLRVAHFEASLNPWQLFRGRVRVRKVRIDAPAVFLHVYDDSTSNLTVLFKPSADCSDSLESRDSSSRALASTWISVRELDVAGGTRLIYTDSHRADFAALDLGNLSFKGNVKLDSTSCRLRRVNLDIDSLQLSALVQGDSLRLDLPDLQLCQKSELPAGRRLPQQFDFSLDAELSALLKQYGQLNVPLAIKADFGLSESILPLDVELAGLGLTLAHIPLVASGDLQLDSGKTMLDNVRVSIDDADLAAVWKNYGPAILPKYADRVIIDRALLDLQATASGEFSAKASPALEASLNLDLAAPGLVLAADASGKEILGGNPDLAVDMNASSNIEALLKNIPFDFGISGSGDFDLTVEGSARLAELQALKADLKAKLNSRSLDLSLPGKIKLQTEGLVAELIDSKSASSVNGLLNFGSLKFRSGDSLSVYVKDMSNYLRLKSDKKKVTDLHELGISNSIGAVAVRAGREGLGVKGIKISAAAARRRQWLAFGGFGNGGFGPEAAAGRDSVRRRGALAQEDDFRSGDVKLDIGEKGRNLLQAWNPEASISVEAARVVSPKLPLRTSVSAMDLDYKNENFTINELTANVGSSDLSLKGSFKGIGRALRRSGVIFADLDISSQRLNANELLTAIEQGMKKEVPDSGAAAAVTDVLGYEQSVVNDSLKNVTHIEKSPLIIVPANVIGKARLNLGRIDLNELDITSLKGNASMRGRTLQLLDGSLQSGVGSIGLEGYYYTRSKKDIAAALDLHLTDLTADKIITMLPGADSLMPMIRSFKGTMSADVALTAKIDTNMQFLLPLTDGVVRLTGKDMYVEDAGSVRKLTRMLLFRNKNIGHMGDLYVDAIIHNSKIEIFPFIFQVDRYTIALNGQQNLDSSFDYCVTVLKWPLAFPFGINVFGSFDNWKFNLKLPYWKANNLPSFDEDIQKMQDGISKSIHDVFITGSYGALARNREQQDSLQRKLHQMNYRDKNEPLGTGMKEKIVESMLQQEEEDENEAFQRELDATVNEIEKEAARIEEKFNKLVKKKKK